MSTNSHNKELVVSFRALKECFGIENVYLDELLVLRSQNNRNRVTYMDKDEKVLFSLYPNHPERFNDTYSTTFRARQYIDRVFNLPHDATDDYLLFAIPYNDLTAYMPVFTELSKSRSGSDYQAKRLLKIVEKQRVLFRDKVDDINKVSHLKME